MEFFQVVVIVCSTLFIPPAAPSITDTQTILSTTKCSQLVDHAGINKGGNMGLYSTLKECKAREAAMVESSRKFLTEFEKPGFAFIKKQGCQKIIFVGELQ